MALTRVWPNGVASMPLSSADTPQLDSTDLAKLDGNEQQALDKTWNGGSAYGTITLGTNGKISLDSPTSKFIVTGNSSTATGGRFQCGNGDVPQLSPAVSRTPLIPMGEYFNSTLFAGPPRAFPWPAIVGNYGWSWYQDPSTTTGGLASAYWNGSTYTYVPNDALVVPLTRMHDGALFTGGAITFVVSSARTELPTRFPQAAIFQYDPFLNITTNLTGWTTYTYLTPGTYQLTLAITGGGSVAIDVGQHVYYLAIVEEDYGTNGTPDPDLGAATEWIGFSLASQVGSMQFQ